MHAPSSLPEQAECANLAECRPSIPEPPRSDASLRAEASYRDWSSVPLSHRPLAAPRSAHAAALFGVLKDHGYSAERLAAKLQVNERQVRKYLEGSVPIPTTILDAMPATLAADLAARLSAVRGEQAQSAVARLRSALTALEREGTTSEVVVEAMARLGVIAGRTRR
jgi:hypothetical protein